MLCFAQVVSVGRYHEASELQRGGNLSSAAALCLHQGPSGGLQGCDPERRVSWTKSPTDRENVGTGVSDDATMRFSHEAHNQFLYVESQDGLESKQCWYLRSGHTKRMSSEIWVRREMWVFVTTVAVLDKRPAEVSFC